MPLRTCTASKATRQRVIERNTIDYTVLRQPSRSSHHLSAVVNHLQYSELASSSFYAAVVMRFCFNDDIKSSFSGLLQPHGYGRIASAPIRFLFGARLDIILSCKCTAVPKKKRKGEELGNGNGPVAGFASRFRFRVLLFSFHKLLKPSCCCLSASAVGGITSPL